ncbi:MAG TPA: DUF2142 domain-containing protein [Pengzhenrongella sp.]
MRWQGAGADRRVFWWSWGVLWLLASVWALANPLMASPDEPAHVVRAASLVRGQVLPPDGDWGSDVEVPYLYHLVNAYPTCYMFDPTATGVCEIPADRPLDEPTDSATMAGKYNPLYYAVVGLPTFLPPGDGVLYLMRIVSAGLCAFLVALGMRAMAQTPAPAWTVLGAAGALTPMVVFLSSTVNPAAVEIAAAFALWCQLLTLLRHPDPAQTTARMAWVAVSATVLLNARGLSLLYGAVIVGVAVLAAPVARVRDVLRTRGTWPSFGVIGVAGLAAAAWLLVSRSLATGAGLEHPELTVLGVARTTLMSTPAYLTNMVGQFGWMDTNLDPAVLMAFAAAGGLAVLLALAVSLRRERLLLAAIALAVVGLPVLIHASQARSLGIIWQGRYILPVAVGLPVLAGYILVERLGRVDLADGLGGVDLRRLGPALAAVVAVAVAAVQLAAFGQNLHRYVNGADGGWFTQEPGAWLPPLPIAVVLALALLATAGYGLLLVAVARMQPDVAPAPDADVGDGTLDDAAPDDAAPDDVTADSSGERTAR